MKSQAIRADLLMLLAAAIWGVAFVAQREGMETMGPYLLAAQQRQNPILLQQEALVDRL